MKIYTPALTLGFVVAPFLSALARNSNAVSSDSRMQRLTRRDPVELSPGSGSASSASTFAGRNATTFVPSQDKVDSTVSNSTISTLGDVLDARIEQSGSSSSSTTSQSPYLVANALRLMHQGVVVPAKHATIIRRGEGGDNKMTTTAVEADDEECEEDDDDEDAAEECEDDDENDGNAEECDENAGEEEEEGCEEEDRDQGNVSPIGGEIGFVNLKDPDNLAEGSLKGSEGCTKFATAAGGDSCYKLIGSKDNDLLKTFYKNNPSVNSGCKNLKINVAYCVSSAPVTSPANQPNEQPIKETEKPVDKPKTEAVKDNEQKPAEEPKIQPVQDKDQKPVAEEPKKEAQQGNATPQANNLKVDVKTDAKAEAPIVEAKVEEPVKHNDNHGKDVGRKSDYSGKASYYFQHGNAGACGKKRGESEYIVALYPGLYNGGARCGKKISLTNKATGKTLVAEVADLCPTCEYQQVDLSKGLFDALSNGADGIFQVEYGFL